MKVVITGRNFSGGEIDGLAPLLAYNEKHKNDPAKQLEIVDCSAEDFGNGTPAEVLADRIGDAEIVIAGTEIIKDGVLNNCPNLRLISRRGIGIDSINLELCRERGISVIRTTGAVEGAVAEHVLAYLMYVTKRIDLQNQEMKNGIWNRILTPGMQRKVLGLVGFGGIGKEIAIRARGFGMKVIYNCRHPKAEWDAEYDVEYRELDRLLAESDYVSANVPLTDETRGMFGAEQFAAMKPTAYFMNIARAAVADENALAEALKKGTIAGACIDVFLNEPCTDSPLFNCPTAILTPHTAPYTEGGFKAINVKAAENTIDFIEGHLEEKYYVVK